jgi:hypothetical protein
LVELAYRHLEHLANHLNPYHRLGSHHLGNRHLGNHLLAYHHRIHQGSKDDR